MVRLPITPEAMARAETLAAELGQLRDSIRGGRGNSTGFLAEILAADWLSAKHENTYDYDLVLRDGRTADIKAKRTTVSPRPWHSASVANASRRQNCDVYIFCRIVYFGLRPMTGYIMGWMPPGEYFERASFLRSQDVDPDNGYMVRADCWNLPYSDLHDPTELAR